MTNNNVGNENINVSSEKFGRHDPSAIFNMLAAKNGNKQHMWIFITKLLIVIDQQYFP